MEQGTQLCLNEQRWLLVRISRFYYFMVSQKRDRMSSRVWMLLTSRARLQWSTEREAEERKEATGTSKPSCPLQQMCLYLAQVAGIRTEENGEEATTAALRKSMTDWLTNSCWLDVHMCGITRVTSPRNISGVLVGTADPSSALCFINVPPAQPSNQMHWGHSKSSSCPCQHG